MCPLVCIYVFSSMQFCAIFAWTCMEGYETINFWFFLKLLNCRVFAGEYGVWRYKTDQIFSLFILKHCTPQCMVC